MYFGFSNVHSPVVGIGFDPTLYSVEEDSGVVVFVVVNRNPDMEREVTVQFTTIEGTAIGTNYILLLY